MATITGFTAERMQQIEDEAIVDGNVVGNNLILVKNNGNQVDVGNVRGATGPQGAPGEVTAAQLATQVAALQAQITAMAADTGHGLIHKATRVTDETYAGFSPNTFHDISGLTVTFSPTPGRHYLFVVHACFSSEGADTSFDLQAARVGGLPVAANTTYARLANRGVIVSAVQVVTAPSDWAGSQTFKASVRDDTNNTTYLRATTHMASLSVTDLGA